MISGAAARKLVSLILVIPAMISISSCWFTGCSKGHEADISTNSKSDDSRSENSAAEADGVVVSQSPKPPESYEWQSPMEWALLTLDEIENPFIKVQVLNKLALSQLNTGDRVEAISTLQKGLDLLDSIEKEPNRESAVKMLVTTLIMSGENGTALELFQKNIDSEDWNFLLKHQVLILSKKGCFDQAFKIIENISDAEYRVSAYLHIFEESAEQGQLKEILGRLDSIPVGNQQSEFITSLTPVVLEKGNPEQIRLVLKKAESMVIQIRVHELNSKLFLSLVQLRAKSGQIVEALDQIQAYQFDPSFQEIALSEVASILARDGKTEQAMRLALIIKTPMAVDPILKSLVETLVREKQFDRALTVSEGIEAPFTKESAMSMIVLSLARAGKGRQVQQILGKTFQIKEHTSFPRQLARALVAGKDPESALLMANQFQDETQKSFYLSDLCQALSEVGEFKRSLNIANSIEPLNLRGHAMSRIVGALCDRGEVNQAREIALTIRDVDMKASGMNKVAQALVKADQFEQAFLLVKMIQPQQHRVIYLDQLAINLMNRGKRSQALSVIEESINNAAEIDSQMFLMSNLLMIATEADSAESRKESEVFKLVLKKSRMKRSFSPEENRVASLLLDAYRQNRKESERDHIREAS